MKALLVSLSHRDFQAVQPALITDGFDVMVLSTPTGIFRRGNVSFTVISEEELVDRALELIRSSITPASNPGAEVLIFNLVGHLQL
jgi:uncharacterized protein YaaQ